MTVPPCPEHGPACGNTGSWGCFLNCNFFYTHRHTHTHTGTHTHTHTHTHAHTHTHSYTQLTHINKKRYTHTPSDCKFISNHTYILVCLPVQNSRTHDSNVKTPFRQSILQAGGWYVGPAQPALRVERFNIREIIKKWREAEGLQFPPPSLTAPGSPSSPPWVIYAGEFN